LNLEILVLESIHFETNNLFRKLMAPRRVPRIISNVVRLIHSSFFF
jgi:hypothetical protein